jgi:hypothetical protein
LIWLEKMPQEGDSLNGIRGRSCHGCYYFLCVVSVLVGTLR